MVKRSAWGPIGAGLLVVLAAYVWLRPSPRPVAQVSMASASTDRRGTVASVEDIPRIGLERANAPQEAVAAGHRDLFDFYVPPPPPTPKPTPPPPVVHTPPPAPTPTPVPPLSMKYIATAEKEGGGRRAVFLTDRNEVLTGGEGDTVANRVKVVRINIESVDVQDLWSGQPRRIPLKGN